MPVYGYVFFARMDNFSAKFWTDFGQNMPSILAVAVAIANAVRSRFTGFPGRLVLAATIFHNSLRLHRLHYSTMLAWVFKCLDRSESTFELTPSTRLILKIINNNKQIYHINQINQQIQFGIRPKPNRPKYSYM